MTVMERAIAVPTEFEFRTGANGKRTFEGYAAVFGSDSEPLPFIETIAPGAFRRSLDHDKDHTFVVNHDDGKLLASRRAGTLRLSEDSTGLTVNAPELPNTSYANDLIELHERGEVRSMSFSFSVPRGGDSWNEDLSRRTLNDVKLGHVTVLAGHQPAYGATTAQIRSLAMRLHLEFDALAMAIDDLREGRPLSEEAFALLSSTMQELRTEPAEEETAVSLLETYRAKFAPIAELLESA